MSQPDEIIEEQAKEQQRLLELWGMIIKLTEYPEWESFEKLGYSRLLERDSLLKKIMVTDEDVRVHNFAAGECSGIELMIKLPKEAKQRYDTLLEEKKRTEGRNKQKGE